jgi:hypothetical protein
MDDLRAAEQAASRDELRVWRCTLEVLNLLHSLDDQAHKRIGPEYRAKIRRASEDGRTQAGLTLVRGIAHHHGLDVRAIVWQPVGMFAVQAGELVPIRQYAVQEGKLVPMEVRTAAAVWRPLAELPQSTERLHERDVYYKALVEGKGLIEPLVAAQRFLATLQRKGPVSP